MTKLECNICHEYGVSGKSRRTLLNPDCTRAPWWTLNVLTNLPRWLHWPLEVVFLVLAGYVTHFLPPLLHRSDVPVTSLVLLLGGLLLGGAGELLSRFWQRRLGLRRGKFHRYHCRYCNSHWEWVEVLPHRPQPAQAGTAEPQPTEPVSPVATALLDS